jgi:pimeloyl-ACP methyl ester carboxylesterase
MLISCDKAEIDILHETIHINYKGADMPAYVHGNASDNTFLLVLHGAGSFGLSFRDGIFTEELEEKFAVVYFDQRGQSMSEGYYKKPNDVIALMAEDVDMLTKVLKKRYGADINLFILGHSLGGMISASSLLNHDQYQYKGWINVDGLMDTPSVSDARKELIIDIAKQQINQESKLESDWSKLEDDASQATDYDDVLGLAGRTIKLLNKDKVINQTASNEKIFQAVVANNPINWLVANFFNQPANQAISNEFSLLDKIQNIEIPTLWIYGSYDVSVPPSTGQTAFAKINQHNKQFYLFNESIHHPHDTEPDLFAELVIEFIERYK